MDPFDESALGILPGTTGQVDPASAFPIAGDYGTAEGTGSGQHGFTPSALGAGAAGIGSAFTSIWRWLNAPFRSPMSPVDITLLIGVIIIAILAWNLILYHLRIAAEAL